MSLLVLLPVKLGWIRHHFTCLVQCQSPRLRGISPGVGEVSYKRAMDSAFS
ncbi:hypothetical protein C4K03_3661 [Pseudomonas synxantha]|uniref:Uncharacterized protein n=1 Tax=Pseudomonas synxantha TaxID=47883 RepID=A0A3G7U8W1_9PSED|nr:hypothetical protein C4K03_3661 [Pseudomonas synxantha]